MDCYGSPVDDHVSVLDRACGVSGVAATVRVEFKDTTAGSPTPTAAALQFYAHVLDTYTPTVQVLLILDYSTLPQFPSPDAGDAEWEAYTSNFAGRASVIASTYGSRVQAYEIWNEEDLSPQVCIAACGRLTPVCVDVDDLDVDVGVCSRATTCMCPLRGTRVFSLRRPRPSRLQRRQRLSSWAGSRRVTRRTCRRSRRLRAPAAPCQPTASVCVVRARVLCVHDGGGDDGGGDGGADGDAVMRSVRSASLRSEC